VLSDNGEDRTKYDQAAETYSSRYADPDAIARRQRDLLASWGSRVLPGASVLELGCADGFVTEVLVRAGYRVTAVDLSRHMIEIARARLAQRHLEAELIVADVNEFLPGRDYDAVLGLMWTFFAYARDPEAVLGRLAERTSKILVDLNPRLLSSDRAVGALHTSGLPRVASRPFFIPQRYRLGLIARTVLRAAELTPGVRALILKRKFVVILKGER
jgi:SAM-dependent methyltransferase